MDPLNTRKSAKGFVALASMLFLGLRFSKKAILPVFRVPSRF